MIAALAGVVAFAGALLAAACCANIAARKHRNVLGYTLLGFVLPVVGVLVALTVDPASQARAR